MKRRVLYLPIEIKGRELNGKILLASRAAERGWLVLMGQTKAVREALPDGPRGVFMEISIAEHKAKRIAGYKSLGHSIAILCEESIVYFDGRDYCRRKVGSAALANTDIMLVSGARNEQHLRQYRPESADKIVLTGNLSNGFQY